MSSLSSFQRCVFRLLMISLQRQLVLDYLVHNCYTSAASAFVRESSGPKDVDADGDELMTSPVKEAPTDTDGFEQGVAMGELRKGAPAILPFEP